MPRLYSRELDVRADCDNCGASMDYQSSPEEWADEFASGDAVLQEQMLANLSLLMPHLTIEWKK